MGREHGQKGEQAICKDGDTNYVARCLMVSLLLLITCDITVAFIRLALSCHLFSTDNETSAFAMSLTQRLYCNLKCSCFIGQSKDVHSTKTLHGRKV